MILGNANTTSKRAGLLTGRLKSQKPAIPGIVPTIRWIRLNKNECKVRPHQNLKRSTLVILVKGKHNITFTKTLQKITLQKQGDYVLIPPKTLHSWVCGKDNTTLLAVSWRKAQLL